MAAIWKNWLLYEEFFTIIKLEEAEDNNNVVSRKLSQIGENDAMFIYLWLEEKMAEIIFCHVIDEYANFQIFFE